MHTYFLTLFLGLALAIPVGPVTIEMMRRNLRFGASRGIVMGCGATSADVLYLLLLLFGVLPFLTNSSLLHILGIAGAIVLIWFAYKAMRAPKPEANNNDNDQSLLHCFSSGFLIALLSPFNLIFWISMAAQLASIIDQGKQEYLFACLGLFTGTAIWFVSLNLVVHHTRHYLGGKTMKYLNYIGGIGLLGFAVYTIFYVLTH